MVSTPQMTPRVGRPTVLARDERESLILEAMEQVLLEKGVRGATMAAVARAAGMSKRTLYAVYENREALFEALFRRLRTSAVRPLGAEAEGWPLERRLKALLRREAADAASSGKTCILRAIIAEGDAQPSIAEALLREGPRTARAIVAQELARARRDGEIAIEDIDAAAGILLDMVHAPMLEALLAPELAEPSPEALEARLTLAIDIFLNGVPRPGAPEDRA